MSGEPPAYLFLSDEHLPERWRDRAVLLMMVPLLPEEASSILAAGTAVPALEPQDERLSYLVARGLPVSAIARELSEPLRSVQRRVGRLRERFDVQTTAELAAELSRKGFSLGAGGPTEDAGHPLPRGEGDAKGGI